MSALEIGLGRMDYLPVDDVRQIVRLLGEVAVLETDLPGKRRFLMNALAKLVEADYWAWVHVRDQSGDGLPMGFMAISGGWDSESQQRRFAEATISPAAAPLNASMRKGCDVHITRLRKDVFSDEEWSRTDLAKRYFEPANIGEFLSSLYPLGNKVFSSIALLRRAGRPAFSSHEVCIVHLIFGEIDWLHREGTDVPAAEHVSELTTRQRQVLIQLLSGDGSKLIAQKLSLSIHTVNDHLKQIYQRFGVSGRGELLAQFLSGGRTDRAGM
jgi:DNA-binding CsgD family transcriptional regulator